MFFARPNSAFNATDEKLYLALQLLEAALEI